MTTEPAIPLDLFSCMAQAATDLLMKVVLKCDVPTLAGMRRNPPPYLLKSAILSLHLPHEADGSLCLVKPLWSWVPVP